MEAMKSVTSAWTPLVLPLAAQPLLQRQVVFQPPVAQATLPVVSSADAGATRTEKINAALADLRERQERIESLLREFLGKDEE